MVKKCLQLKGIVLFYHKKLLFSNIFLFACSDWKYIEYNNLSTPSQEK